MLLGPVISQDSLSRPTARSEQTTVSPADKTFRPINRPPEARLEHHYPARMHRAFRQTEQLANTPYQASGAACDSPPLSIAEYRYLRPRDTDIL